MHRRTYSIASAQCHTRRFICRSGGVSPYSSAPEHAGGLDHITNKLQLYDTLSIERHWLNISTKTSMYTEIYSRSCIRATIKRGHVVIDDAYGVHMRNPGWLCSVHWCKTTNSPDAYRLAINATVTQRVFIGTKRNKWHGVSRCAMT